jgi:hypothetical protein
MGSQGKNKRRKGILPAGLLNYARVISDNPAVVIDPEPFVHPVNSPGILRLHDHRDKSEDAFGERLVSESCFSYDLV